ncbi:SWIM zinc finger family protein [Haladaptatus sp. NG-SE-30]
MSTKQSAPRDTAETAPKRAQWEQFFFNVEVTNESHENLADHQYTVSIDDVTEELMACTCSHHAHRNAFCKHMAAVENATEDGTLDAFPSEDKADAEPDNCDCEGLEDFPCWPCVKTGRKELPE